jgi:N6-adenosine-specific RNA methylase IME4
MSDSLIAPGLLPGEFTPTGLRLPEDLSFDDWRNLGRNLLALEKSVGWWVGDWVREGDERDWGQMYVEAEGITGKAYKTLRNSAWVANAFDLSRRRDKLSFKHHAEVASLPPSVADAMLDEAEKNQWSTRELRAAVSQFKVRDRLEIDVSPDVSHEDSGCTVNDLFALVETGKKFGTIYADPPWLYDNQGTRGATGNHYSGMTVEELCALPVKNLAAEDAHLHLWTTNGFLFECPKIFEAWGFEFRSSFVWVKPEMGMGNYWRNSHEILLTAIRGDAKSFNVHNIMSWLECSRSEHSTKPEKVREFIELASPPNRLELFARARRDGWLVWGNDIRASLFDRTMREVA